jgi:hypothetical protein
MNKSSLLFITGILILFLTNCTTKEQTRKVVPINSVKDVLINLSPLTNTFDVNPKEEIVIKGNKGTAIYIPSDAFQFADGATPTESVKIELKECYSLSDMIAENLSTIAADGRILQSCANAHKEIQVKNKKTLIFLIIN